ncbi:MAG: hypothetical protein H7X94_10570, partial [Vallitaleaceae bacterium]|nr:hypothetical protein [Vallitaleaceae bacterium]
NYIVGMDLGQQSAVITYLEHKTLKPEVYDLSGGYGELSVPLVLQYHFSDNSWLIGHDAKLNQEQENTFFVDDLRGVLLRNEVIQIGKEQFLPFQLLQIYIEKILDSFKHLNPKYSIIGIGIALSDWDFKPLKPPVERALAGIYDVKATIVPATLSLYRYLQQEGASLQGETQFIDFGYGCLSTTLAYQKDQKWIIKPKTRKMELSVAAIGASIIKEMTSFYQDIKGSKVIEFQEQQALKDLFEASFARLLQKYGKKEPVKIVYNFAYPPVQQTLSYESMQAILQPFERLWCDYLAELNAETDKFLFMGQGLKMPWLREFISKDLNQKGYIPIDVVAKGSCYMAAKDYVPYNDLELTIEEEKHKKYSLVFQSDDPYVIPLTISQENQEEVALTHLWILDFEETKSLVVQLISEQGEEITIEAEKVIANELTYENKGRLYFKLVLTSDKKAQMTLEVLPL